jgi:hypothetical protein
VMMEGCSAILNDTRRIKFASQYSIYIDAIITNKRRIRKYIPRYPKAGDDPASVANCTTRKEYS